MDCTIVYLSDKLNSLSDSQGRTGFRIVLICIRDHLYSHIRFPSNMKYAYPLFMAMRRLKKGLQPPISIKVDRESSISNRSHQYKPAVLNYKDKRAIEVMDSDN